MFVIGIVGIASALLAVQFKSVKPEYSVYISLCGCIIIFFYSLRAIQSIMDLFDQIATVGTIGNGYLKILLKITGIAFVAEITSDIATDCGYQSLAKQIQVFGKLSILVMSLPIFTEIILLIGNLLS